MLYYIRPRQRGRRRALQEGGAGSVLLFLHVGEAHLAKLDIDVAKVRKLVELVEAHGLEELTVEEGDLSVTIKGPAASVPMVVQPGAQTVPVEAALVAPAPPGSGQQAAKPEEKLEGNIADIVAPLVGIFYRAPAPDSPSFVEIGDQIEAGTEVGLIEAMKVFSPIPSEVAGVVVAIPAENGKLVQQGTVLVRVRVAE